jgi:hypothetical protein
MESYTKYYLLESGEILKMAEDYRNDFFRKQKEMFEYVESIGGDGYKLGGRDGLCSVHFPNDEQPKDFKKPDSQGCCQPYKRSKYAEEFKKYRLPSCLETFKDYLGCPTSLSYEYDGASGCTCIGHPFNPIGVYWYCADGPLLLSVPDIQRYTKNIREGREDVVFKNGMDKWTIDKPGAKAILKEEWDLMVAKHEQKTTEIEEA